MPAVLGQYKGELPPLLEAPPASEASPETVPPVVEMLPEFPAVKPLIQRIGRGIYSAAGWCFGMLSLIGGLSVILGDPHRQPSQPRLFAARQRHHRAHWSLARRLHRRAPRRAAGRHRPWHLACALAGSVYRYAARLRRHRGSAARRRLERWHVDRHHADQPAHHLGAAARRQTAALFLAGTHSFYFAGLARLINSPPRAMLFGKPPSACAFPNYFGSAPAALPARCCGCSSPWYS